MALIDTLPLIDDFTHNPADQQTFFNKIQTVMNTLCVSSTPIVLTSATEPTHTAFETAWKAAAIGNTLPIPKEQKFIWFNGSQIMGIYRTIDDEMTIITGGSSMDWSPIDDKFLFCASIEGANSSVYLSDFYGNLTQLGGTPANARGYVRWSPDGTKCVFVENLQIWTATANVAMTGLTQLTTGAFSRTSPHWLGTKIVYSSAEFGGVEIVIMNDNGTGVTRLTNNATNEITPRLSPNGLKIAYSSDASGSFQIWIMDANGANQTQLTNEPSVTTTTQPIWSSDGVWIYYTVASALGSGISGGVYRIKPDGSGREEVWVKPIPTSELLAMNALSNWEATFQAYLPSSNGTLISIAPDGTRFAFNEGIAASSYSYGVSGVRAFTNSGYKSTGKLYKVSQNVSTQASFRLIKADVFDGTVATSSLASYELPEAVDHLLIVIDVAGAANVTEGLAFLRFNGDSTANNYESMQALTLSTVASRQEYAAGSQAGIPFPVCGTTTAGISESFYTIWIPDIRSVFMKQAFIEGGHAPAVTATTNWRTCNAVGVWNQTDPIVSIIITLAAALGNFITGASICYYGLRGKASWQ